ncbi:MAG: JAB domain-containing protein [Lactobacillaceae bacterium]|jgi:DNA repair protein RadC|nr:JAB domain-containing protein [Lactobacillaceae bacterium]
MNQQLEQLRLQLINRPQEECWALYLNSQMEAVGEACIAKGSLVSVVIHPRDVFRNAVALNAYSVLLLHNHPSGNILPSQADMQVARQLVVCGQFMQIHLQDFMIVTRKGYYSFVEQDKLPRCDLKTISEIWTFEANL